MLCKYGSSMGAATATFTTYEIAERAGVDYHVLLRWARSGIIKPAKHDGKQKHAVLWNQKNLREASILAGLRRAGVSLYKLREILSFLRDVCHHNPMSEGEFYLALDDNGSPSELIKVTSNKSAMSLLRRRSRGQLLLPLATPEVKKQTRNKKRKG